MMSVVLKKCSHRGCGVQFPVHYFHDYCVKHNTKSDNRRARKRSLSILEKHGIAGLIVNTMSSLLPDEEAAETRRLLYGRKEVGNAQA